MNAEQRDAICQLWIEIFGTQEGAGYNCPQGAYDFAEVVMSYEREACAKVCDDESKKFLDTHMGMVSLKPDAILGATTCAAAIRARGDK